MKKRSNFFNYGVCIAAGLSAIYNLFSGSIEIALLWLIIMGQCIDSMYLTDIETSINEFKEEIKPTIK